METRREVLKKLAYTVPAVMSVTVRPAFAASGYDAPRHRGNNGVGNGFDPQPPGNPPVNDGRGTSKGNPGNRKGK
jgi:hypothetical protein